MPCISSVCWCTPDSTRPACVQDIARLDSLARDIVSSMLSAHLCIRTFHILLPDLSIHHHVDEWRLRRLVPGSLWAWREMAERHCHYTRWLLCCRCIFCRKTTKLAFIWSQFNLLREFIINYKKILPGYHRYSFPIDRRNNRTLGSNPNTFTSWILRQNEVDAIH